MNTTYEVLTPLKWEVMPLVLPIFEQQLNASLQNAKNTWVQKAAPALQPQSEIRMMETCLSPNRSVCQTAANFCSVAIEYSQVVAALCAIDPAARHDTSRNSIIEYAAVPYEGPQSNQSQKLLLSHPQVTATLFLNTFIKAVEQLVQKLQSKSIPYTNDPSTGSMAIMILVEHALAQTRLESAELLDFANTCPSDSNDSLEGIDLVSLCNMGLERAGILATVGGVITHTTAALIWGNYCVPRNVIARCLVAIHVGSTVAVSYVDKTAAQHNFEGSIVHVDITRFHGDTRASDYSTLLGLPYCVVDFDVDFNAAPRLLRKRSMERMIAAHFLPEIARQLLIRILKKSAPRSMWRPNSLSFKGCLAILQEAPNSNNVTLEVLKRSWEWEPSDGGVSVCPTVKLILREVFMRSAGLVAMVIAAIARKTGRLQAALGGVTVAISGCLGVEDIYLQMIRVHLDKLLGRNTEHLVVFRPCADGGMLGAAVVNASSN